MDGFFSKASSFLNSQAEHEPPPASSHEDKSEEKSHKAPSSGGYGDLLASAQSLMGSAKPHGTDGSDEKEGETHKAPSSGGYGDLLASAQSLMGSAKLSGGGEGKLPVDDKGEGKPVDKKAAAHGDSGYGDVYASAQVLMGAARDSAAADMGEVAGAAANLIGAGTRYGNLEKGAYGEYANKAQTYLHDYQTSHSKPSPQAVHKPSSVGEGKDEEESKAHEAPLKSSVNSEEGEPPRRKYADDE